MIGDGFLTGVGLALFVMMASALYRIVAGPTAIDRIVAVNIIGTKTAVLLVVIGQIFHDVSMFVDFALAYALLNFIGSLAASRYLHKIKTPAIDPAPLENHREKADMQIALDILSIFLILSGLVFYLGAAVGLMRFPDFYTRMHAAGKGDTLSSLLIVLGLAIHMMSDPTQANGFVFVKLMAICAFIMLTSPTSTHALMDAGYEDGIKPQLKDGSSDDLEMK